MKNQYTETDPQSLIRSSTAVILAGGKSSRMNYYPKSHLPWQGGSFLSALSSQLTHFSRCVVSVDRKDRFENIGETVEDRYADCGPLSGIYSSLEAADTQLVFITACDTPLLKSELVEYLFRQWKPQYDCCIAKTGDGRIHPLCGIYKKELAPVLRQSLEQGDRRVMRFLEQQNLHIVEIPAEMEEQLTNVNTQEIYQGLCGQSVTE